MSRGRCLLLSLYAAALLWITPMAQATVALTGTRLILSAGHEATIEARNRSDHEVLLQAWLAPAGNDADPAQALPHQALPFVVTPGLVRLPAQARHPLRVLYHGAGMPAGQESLVHLYVLEIPRRSVAGQQLNIAVRQRINVFYRPPGLPGDPADAPARLRWSMPHEDERAPRLLVDNPTAFHVSLLDLRLDGRAVHQYLLLAPGQRFEWPMRHSRWQQLTFNALTDYGGQRSYCAQATQRAPVTARLLDTSLMAGDC